MATALITGASSGIGRDFAILLSRKGYNLILVGRSLSRLEAVLPKLSHKRVRLLALDLSKPEHCYELYRQCQSESWDSARSGLQNSSRTGRSPTSSLLSSTP